jgi:hypothetical protein
VTKYLEPGPFSVASGFGEGTKEKGGRWIWDKEQQKLVRYEDYIPPSHAKDAPIMLDRWYEGSHTLDGDDIGSRAKRKEYMRSHGLVDANDYSQSYHDRQRAEKAREDRREVRRTVEEVYRQHRATPTVERVQHHKWTEGIDG